MKTNIIEEKMKNLNKECLEQNIKNLKIYRKKLVKYVLITGGGVAINVLNTFIHINCNKSLIMPSICLGITGYCFYKSLFILSKANKTIKDKKEELIRLKNSINLIDTVAVDVEECHEKKEYVKRRN